MHFFRTEIVLILLFFHTVQLTLSSKNKDITMEDEDDDFGEFDDNYIVPDDEGIFSHRLEGIIKFYNDTLTLLEKVEIVVKSDPLNSYMKEVHLLQERVEKIIKRLQNYLTEGAETWPDAENYEIFIKSIESEMEAFDSKFPLLEQMKEPKILLQRVKDEREVLLALMEDMAERVEYFELGIEDLEMFGIALRDPDDDVEGAKGKPIPVNYDLSVLTGLVEIYKKIEGYNKILLEEAIKEGQQKSNKVSTSTPDLKLQNETNEKLKITNQELKSYLADNAAVLRQFYNVLKIKRQRIWELMMDSKTESDEQREKMFRVSGESLTLLRKLDDLYAKVQEKDKQARKAREEL